MSKATNKYIAMNPTDSIMMIMQNGVCALKFVNNYGLLQSFNGGTSFFRVNPLVLIITLTKQSGSTTYTPNAIYNPLGKATPSVTRSAKGIFVVSHNLGNASHTVIGTAKNYEGEYVMYVTPYSIGTSTDTIYTADDSSKNDPDLVTLHFFDYKSY